MRLKYPEMLAIVVHEKKNMLHSPKKTATLGTKESGRCGQEAGMR